MDIEELEFVEGGRFADAIPALRACAGLSLPSNVPVGALCDVVEALKAMQVAFIIKRSHYSRSLEERHAEKLTHAALCQLSEYHVTPKDEGPEIELPFSVIMEKCNDWDAFCNDVGLNPWCFNEGLASSSDTYSAPLSTFQKHGII